MGRFYSRATKRAGSIALALLALGSLGIGLQHSPTPKPVAPLKQGPIAYFTERCSRCHGPVDSPDNSAFEKALTDEEIRRWVVDMANGPGGAPLEGEGLESQIALHRASIDKQPFIAFTSIQKQELKGEVSPRVTLTAVVLKKPVKVVVKDSSWTLTLPKKAKVADVILTATTKTSKSQLDLSKSAYTHQVKKP